jgi:hypothetical protein
MRHGVNEIVRNYETSAADSSLLRYTTLQPVCVHQSSAPFSSSPTSRRSTPRTTPHADTETNRQPNTHATVNRQQHRGRAYVLCLRYLRRRSTLHATPASIACRAPTSVPARRPTCTTVPAFRPVASTDASNAHTRTMPWARLIPSRAPPSLTTTLTTPTLLAPSPPPLPLPTHTMGAQQQSQRT